MVICLERGANDLHIVQLMPVAPIISISLATLVLAYPDVLEERPLNGHLSSQAYFPTWQYGVKEDGEKDLVCLERLHRSGMTTTLQKPFHGHYTGHLC